MPSYPTDPAACPRNPPAVMIPNMTARTAHPSAMFRKLKKSTAAFLLAVSLIACSPHSAWADPGKIDDDAHYDARVQGYDPDIELPSASSGLCWFLLICFAVGCVSVIFKDAKRSHLD